MKKIFICTFLLLLGSFAFAQKEYGLRFSSIANDTLTLENAIRLGLENNSDFLTAEQEVIIAEKKINEAKFRYLPQFDIQGTATWYNLDYPMVLSDAIANRLLPSSEVTNNENKFFGVGITATQYIYAGGRISNTLKMARANLKQVQNKYESIKNIVVLDIKQSFYNLLYAKEYANATKALLELAQKLNSTKTQDPWIKIRNEAIIADLQAKHSEAQKAFLDAHTALLISLNKELNAQVTIQGNLTPTELQLDLSRLQFLSTEFRPELKSATYALEANNIAIDVALSHRYPDLILNASYEKLGANSLEDTNKQVSLALKLPLPYNISSQLAQKKAEQKKTVLQRAAIEDTIQRQVVKSYNDLSFWQEEVLLRKKAYEKLETLVNKNKSPNSYTFEALQAYLQVTNNYLEALKNNQIAKAKLEWAIGQDL